MDASYLRLDRHSLPEPHIFAAGPRVSLVITRGRVQQRVRPVRGRVFLIGSAHDCDLVLGDLTFPEAYAYLFVDGPRVTIRRLGDGPPLAVCGEQVDTAELFHDDTIAFGPFELRLAIEDPPRGRRRGSTQAFRQGERSSSAASGPEGAIDEVQSLLRDIQRELAESAAGLRVYEVSAEDESPGRSPRASA